MQEPTDREVHVAHLIATGMSNAEIAVALTIELSTVESHVHHLLQKLGARSRVEIALWWFQRGK